MRKLISLAAAVALVASTTASIAADTQASSSQPLAPGGAAGVHNAQVMWGTPWFWVGAGIVGLAVGTALVLSNNNGHGNNSTTATNTTP